MEPNSMAGLDESIYPAHRRDQRSGKAPGPVRHLVRRAKEEAGLSPRGTGADPANNDYKINNHA